MAKPEVTVDPKSDKRKQSVYFPVDMLEEIQNLVEDKLMNSSLKNVAGEAITERLTEALVTPDGSRVYAVREGIPVLLADEAILLPLEK